MSDYPDSGDMNKERLRRQMSKEETPGTPVGGVLHTMGTVTWLGDDGPETFVPVRETKGPEILQHLPGGSIVVTQSVIASIIPLHQRLASLEGKLDDLANTVCNNGATWEQEKRIYEDMVFDLQTRVAALEAQIAKWLNT